MTFKITYKRYGENAILMQWPNKIAEDILFDIKSFCAYLNQVRLDFIIEYNFVFNSLLIVYKNNVSFNFMVYSLSKIYNDAKFLKLENQSKNWKIPVCYDSEFGVDLDVLSKKNTITIDEIISLHTSVKYRVFGIGFLPGFLYLGGLHEKLIAERKSTPRLLVPKGSVAIGGAQTGIYPIDSPGGWQIIGKTPIELFSPNSNIPSKFSPGDTVEFFEISKQQFTNEYFKI